MQVSAKLRHLRTAPRKVRLIADLVRGKSAERAQAILNFTTKKAAESILKLLNSALANAKNSFQLDPANLYISKITVDEGPKIKRWRARARGSANEIQKKTSHINLTLEEITKSKTVKKAKEEKKAEKAEKIEEIKPEKVEETEKTEKAPKLDRRELKTEIKKPLVARGMRKIFRRQVF